MCADTSCFYAIVCAHTLHFLFFFYKSGRRLMQVFLFLDGDTVSIHAFSACVSHCSSPIHRTGAVRHVGLEQSDFGVVLLLYLYKKWECSTISFEFVIFL